MWHQARLGISNKIYLPVLQSFEFFKSEYIQFRWELAQNLLARHAILLPWHSCNNIFSALLSCLIECTISTDLYYEIKRNLNTIFCGNAPEIMFLLVVMAFCLTAPSHYLKQWWLLNLIGLHRMCISFLGFFLLLLFFVLWKYFWHKPKESLWMHVFKK